MVLPVGSDRRVEEIAGLPDNQKIVTGSKEKPKSIFIIQLLSKNYSYDQC
jgi:hypothetical protein